MHTETETYTPAPTLYDAHLQWHSIHGALALCPLDCGIGEAAASDYEEDPVAAPQVSCGHCKGRHTVAGVAVCAATHWASR